MKLLKKHHLESVSNLIEFYSLRNAAILALLISSVMSPSKSFAELECNASFRESIDPRGNPHRSPKAEIGEGLAGLDYDLASVIFDIKVSKSGESLSRDQAEVVKYLKNIPIIDTVKVIDALVGSNLINSKRAIFETKRFLSDNRYEITDTTRRGIAYRILTAFNNDFSLRKQNGEKPLPTSSSADLIDWLKSETSVMTRAKSTMTKYALTLEQFAELALFFDSIERRSVAQPDYDNLVISVIATSVDLQGAMNEKLPTFMHTTARVLQSIGVPLAGATYLISGGAGPISNDTLGLTLMALAGYTATGLVNMIGIHPKTYMGDMRSMGNSQDALGIATYAAAEKPLEKLIGAFRAQIQAKQIRSQILGSQAFIKYISPPPQPKRLPSIPSLSGEYSYSLAYNDGLAVAAREYQFDKLLASLDEKIANKNPLRVGWDVTNLMGVEKVYTVMRDVITLLSTKTMILRESIDDIKKKINQVAYDGQLTNLQKSQLLELYKNRLNEIIGESNSTNQRLVVTKLNVIEFNNVLAALTRKPIDGLNKVSLNRINEITTDLDIVIKTVTESLKEISVEAAKIVKDI